MAGFGHLRWGLRGLAASVPRQEHGRCQEHARCQGLDRAKARGLPRLGTKMPGRCGKGALAPGQPAGLRQTTADQVIFSSRSLVMSPGTTVTGMGRLPELRLIAVTKGPGPDFSEEAPSTKTPISASSFT